MLLFFVFERRGKGGNERGEERGGDERRGEEGRAEEGKVQFELGGSGHISLQSYSFITMWPKITQPRNVSLSGFR